jgi:hypothetical protein
MRAVFDTFDKDLSKAKKKFPLYRIGSPGDIKTLVRFTDPAEIYGVAQLSCSQKGASDQQWLYVPATRRPRSVMP